MSVFMSKNFQQPTDLFILDREGIVTLTLMVTHTRKQKKQHTRDMHTQTTMITRTPMLHLHLLIAMRLTLTATLTHRLKNHTHTHIRYNRRHILPPFPIHIHNRLSMDCTPPTIRMRITRIPPRILIRTPPPALSPAKNMTATTTHILTRRQVPYLLQIAIMGIRIQHKNRDDLLTLGTILFKYTSSNPRKISLTLSIQVLRWSFRP